MDKKSCRPFFIFILTFFVSCLSVNAPAQTSQNNNSEKSSTNLYEEFKKHELLPCGQRPEAVRLGRLILEQYKLAEDFTASFKTRLSTLEEEELRCSGKSGGKALEDIFEAFKSARNKPCGQRDEAVRLGKEIIEKFRADLLNKAVIDFVSQQTPVIEADDKDCKLMALFDDFKIKRKRPCGERIPAIEIGNRILDDHRGDELNKEVILFVENDVAKLEKEEPICYRNARYNQLYKEKMWREFLVLSKVIIAEEGDTPLALDVMLTFVSVAYGQTAYKGVNSFNTDAVNYAKKAIELIEKGVKTTMRWGTFEPYGTKDKALAWLNYSIGYISYFREKEGKKAIPYFYKAAQFSNAEFKNDAFVYQAVAIHYFEKHAVTPSSLTINEFITKANALGSEYETSDSTEEAAKNNEIATLYKQLVNLHNLRYNLEPNENVNGLSDYILKLINRPLINTASRNGNTSTQAAF